MKGRERGGQCVMLARLNMHTHDLTEIIAAYI